MEALIVLFGFLAFVAGILGTIWVFIDASVNSEQSAVLWGLVALFGGIVGILLYVLLGRNATETSSKLSGRSNRPDRSGHPSHVYQNCGEEYYLAEDATIDGCLSCGGVNVEQAWPR